MSAPAAPKQLFPDAKDYCEVRELLKAVLFSAGRPLSPKYLSDAIRLPERDVIEVLSTPSRDGKSGLDIHWDGHNAELVVAPQFSNIVYTATKSDVMHSLSLIEEYLSAQKQRGHSPNTIKGYRQFMTRFARDIGRPLDEVTTRDVRRFLMREERERNNSVSTIASKIHRLKSLYKWLAREELIERNPMLKIDAPQLPRAEPRYLTHEEIERIREVATGLDRVIFETLYSSGIRREEAVNLDWHDINFDERALFVRYGKGGKSRMTMLSTRAVLLLKNYRESRIDDDPCVFRSQFRRRMSKENINRRMRALGEKAGLRERLTPHRLRHSMARHLLNAGMRLDAIQMLLGHADTRTTQRYTGLPEQQLGHYRAVFP